MTVWGIVGGVASGKSLVARQLAELGAELVDADRVAHEALDEPEIEAAIRKRWGERVFDSAGKVRRPALAEVVFEPTAGGEAELRALEQILHPRVRQRIEEKIRAAREQQRSLLVLDVPLLLEVGWQSLCDRVVFVDATEEVRRARAASRGWSEEEWRRREARQLPPEEKRRRCDFMIDNSGSPEQTRRQVQALWNQEFAGDA